MGKGQSKHGQCYLVNAHFNPLCQLEEANSLQSIETPLTSQDSGLQLTPEISFTLSEEDKSNSDKNLPTKCALQVFLPKESVNAVLKNATMDARMEESNTEPSLKNQQKVVLECVQNNNYSEKQEISFILKNYTGAEVSKDDIEKVVLNSICEALKSSLKLPPSGTHTLKVHLTLSPDQEPSPEKLAAQQQTLVETECPEVIPPDNLSDPVAASTPQKQTNVFAKCCQPETIKNLLHHPTRSFKHDASPSPRPRRHKMLAERKEISKKWIDAANFGRKDFILPNFKSPRHSAARERQLDPPNAEDCSHYLDLARLKISEAKDSPRSDPRCLNPAYCSPRHLERRHKFCHYTKCNAGDFSNHATPKKNNNIDIRQKLRESELHSSVLKYKLLQKAKNNLLDLSFDLCDLDDKQAIEMDSQYQHRRSRSYDTNQYSLVNSPKLRHRTCHCIKCTSSLQHDELVPPSPNRHHRHCHRKREKDKIRAMEQVAQWLDREEQHRNKPSKQETSQNSEECSQDDTVQRHEYHHIHEHHHYYHYIES